MGAGPNDYVMDVWPFGLGVLALVLVMLGRRQRSVSYLACAALFGLYLVLAVEKLFMPLRIGGGPGYGDPITQPAAFMSFVNLVPFDFGDYSLAHIARVQMVQNVLLTIPLGFGLNFVARVRARHYLWLAPAVGVGIEMAQLALSVLMRYAFRIIDVNDALLNALGVLTGYALFRGFARLYVWAVQRFGVRHKGLAAYLSEVAGAHLSLDGTSQNTAG